MAEEETKTDPAVEAGTEEEKPAEAKPEEPAAADDTASYFTKAQELAERVEAANKKTEELVIRQEKVAARMLLSGRAEAGAPQKTTEQIKDDEVQAQVDDALGRFRLEK